MSVPKGKLTKIPAVISAPEGTGTGLLALPLIFQGNQEEQVPKPVLRFLFWGRWRVYISQMQNPFPTVATL
jgi:hypothetical protein